MRKLVVSNCLRLKSKYGDHGFAVIEQALKNIVAFDAARGISTEIFYVDQIESEGAQAEPLIEFPQLMELDPTEPIGDEFDRAIKEINAHCRDVKKRIDAKYKFKKFDYLVILGGNQIVPFFRAPNPLNKLGDSDTSVQTDNPYGVPSRSPISDFLEFLLPEIPVGRIPDEDGSTDTSFIEHQLQMFTRYGRGFDEDKYSGWALSALKWNKLTTSVANSLHISDIEDSPPIDLNSHPISSSQRRNVHYFNVHGGKNVGTWFGEDNQVPPNEPKCFGPFQVWQLHLSEGACLLSEACYGAFLINKTLKGSILLSFLQAGGGAVVGSTTIAYGSDAPPLNCADVLAEEFFKALRQGEPTGSALLRAKKKLYTSGSPFGGLKRTEQKTLLQFCLFGDPSYLPFPKAKKTLKPQTELVDELVEINNTLAPLVASVEPKSPPAVSESITRGVSLLSDLESWWQEIERSHPSAQLAAEIEEQFETPVIKSNTLQELSVVRSYGPETIRAVHRAYFADNAHSDSICTLIIVSAYFINGELSDRSVVSSKHG